jgi:hypothetical protein
MYAGPTGYLPKKGAIATATKTRVKLVFGSFHVQKLTSFDPGNH